MSNLQNWFTEITNHTSIKESSITFNLSKFILITFQLALTLLVVYLFRIEEQNGLLLIILPLFISFVIHSMLPIKYRSAFFVLSSMIAFGFVLGTVNTLILITIALFFIGIAQLPISFVVKVLLLVLSAVGLVLLRLNFIPTPWAPLVMPVIGSMFMFRMILYMYEMKKNDLKSSIWMKLQYFFMIPNVSFPLFPIVDFKTYLHTYYDQDQYEIYQKGIQWIIRGVIQLLLYRIIYMYFVSSPSKVVDTGTLIVYLLSNYALLFKISGQAHLIVGVLCLFGLDLPQIFNKYLLASGFSDFWRRINIYWKDFVMKIFYYPIFFQLRKMGMVTGTVITLMIMFLLTWLLHSYQFFWLTGSFPLTSVDGLFWGIFGIFVTINSVLQMKKKKKKNLAKKGWSFIPALKLSAKIVAMFVFMCLLWSLWSSVSIREWISLISVFQTSSSNEVLIMILVLVLVTVLGAMIQYPIEKLVTSNIITQKSFSKNSGIAFLSLTVILIARMHEYYLPEDSKFSVLIRPIEEQRLNVADIEESERGYYEPILSSNQLTKSLDIQIKEVTPKDWHEKDQNIAIRKSLDMLVDELIPNTKTTFKGTAFEINSFGLRDKEYTLEKPNGTFRMALLGGSFEMSSGVEAYQGYEWLIEDRLNLEKPVSEFNNYEFFNFGVGGYGMTHCVKLIDSKVLKYDMDAVIYICHSREYDRAIGRLYKQILSGADLEYDFLKKIIKDAKLDKKMPRSEFLRKLDNVKTELIRWGYKKMAEQCNDSGVVPVWVFLPTLEGLDSKEEYAEMSKLAKEAGFKITIDLSHVYDGHDLLTLWVQPWDRHPNVEGHQLIANMLYTKLMKNKNILFNIKNF